MSAQQNQNSNSQGSAAQMGAEDQARQEAYAKAKTILKGALIQSGGSEYGAAHWLAIQIQNLTSSSKFDREHGKDQIRELVKIGKGE